MYIVLLFNPATVGFAAEVDERFVPGVQLYVYGVAPPTTAKLILPVPPKHDALVTVVFNTMAGDSKMIIESRIEHPCASVTIT